MALAMNLATLKLALRAVQAVFALIVLACAAAVISALEHDWTGLGFSIFCAITTWIIAGFAIFVALWRPPFMQIAPKGSRVPASTIWSIVYVCVDAVWTVYWLAAAASLSTGVGYVARANEAVRQAQQWAGQLGYTYDFYGGFGARAGAYQAATAFSWLEFFVFIPSVVFSAFDLHKELRNRTAAGTTAAAPAAVEGDAPVKPAALAPEHVVTVPQEQATAPSPPPAEAQAPTAPAETPATAV